MGGGAQNMCMLTVGERALLEASDSLTDMLELSREKRTELRSPVRGW